MATTSIRLILAAHALRKGLVAVAGSSVLCLGVALILLPGPSTLLIALGLTILATEFGWARRLLYPFRRFLRWLRDAVRRALGAGSAPGSA